MLTYADVCYGRPLYLRRAAPFQPRAASARTLSALRQHTSAYVSIRQHTSAYVSIRQHTSAYVSIRQIDSSALHQRVYPFCQAQRCQCLWYIFQHTSAYASIRQHTSAYVSAKRSAVSACLRAGAAYAVNGLVQLRVFCFCLVRRQRVPFL
jgi:hypothetical protein